MAPPRFQCLNATRQLGKNGSGLRAAFSTSRMSQADDPFPRRSAGSSELLSLLDDAPSRPTSSTPANSFQNTGLSGSKRNSSKAVGDLMRHSEMLAQRHQARMAASRAINSGEMENSERSQALSRQIPRRWKAGDVYAPHDLSGVEMAKWKTRERPLYDVFDALNLNPLEHYRNFSIMSEYMTPMGRIKHSKETGLRPVNQRKIAKAIRRSIGLGMMPSVHRHPEILYKMAARMNQALSPSRTLPL